MTRRSMAAAIDKSLANEVKRELEWDPVVEAATVGVDVKGGAVTLSGCVRSESERRAAVRAAERVYGVRHVDMPCTPSRVWDAMHSEHSGGSPQ